MNNKPSKPSPDFPLFAHASGKWAKKINGKLRYFGRWDDPAGALAEYRQSQSTDNLAELPDGITLGEASNKFLDAKHESLQRGDLSTSSFGDYRRTCQWLLREFPRSKAVESFGPEDFARYKSTLASRRTAGSLGNEITRVRVLFKWCYDSRLIPAPVHFGPEFRKPSAKTLRKHRREKGKKLFTPGQIHAIMDECGVHLRAMVLLGINCGFGNNDCATLPLAAVDLDREWISYPRPKTEVDRESPLWPETACALRVSLSRRPEAKDGSEHLFFVKADGEGFQEPHSVISKRIRAAILAANLKRGGFYWLRHTFETVAGETKDQVAVNAIMGHADQSMAAVYREEISEERLRAATDHVRNWLF